MALSLGWHICSCPRIPSSSSLSVWGSFPCLFLSFILNHPLAGISIFASPKSFAWLPQVHPWYTFLKSFMKHPSSVTGCSWRASIADVVFPELMKPADWHPLPSVKGVQQSGTMLGLAHRCPQHKVGAWVNENIRKSLGNYYSLVPHVRNSQATMFLTNQGLLRNEYSFGRQKWYILRTKE